MNANNVEDLPAKVIHQDTTAGEVFLQAKRIQK